jgi:hypothetical protein
MGYDGRIAIKHNTANQIIVNGIPEILKKFMQISKVRNMNLIKNEIKLILNNMPDSRKNNNNKLQRHKF